MKHLSGCELGFGDAFGRPFADESDTTIETLPLDTVGMVLTRMIAEPTGTPTSSAS